MIEDLEHSVASSDIDIRNALAVERTRLAAERTYAAWLRTGLAALASGAGAPSLLEGIVSARLNRVVSCVLLLFAVVCFGAAAWREMRPTAAWRRSAAPHLTATILCLASGALTLISLVVMVGVWRHQ